MSGGGGGGRQMPMASNRGQQMQNPQMGFGQSALGQMQGGQSAVGQMGQMAPQVGMMPKMGGNQITPQNPAALFAPQVYQQQQMPGPGGMFGSPTGNIMETDQPMAGQPQMYPQAFDQFRQEEMMMGGMQPAMGGIGALSGQMPMNDPYGMPYETPKPMPMGRGFPGGPPLVSQPVRPMIGTQGPGDGLEPSLPGRGMPPAYGPTKGPIDGRKLRDMMDIRTRRPVDGLPNALENNLPPSLKRPTQNRRG
jgi:hypothetical protein